MEKSIKDNGAHSYTEAATYEGEKIKPNIFKPILSSTEMVQAILAGRKSQTRRICKVDPLSKLIGLYTRRRLWNSDIEENPNPLRHFAKFDFNGVEVEVKSKYTQGDILWVRETFAKVPVENSSVDGNEIDIIFKYQYKADKEESFLGWKPSLFMPKEAARIFLKVTNVRCERLNDISESDAIAEGVDLGDLNKGIIYRNYLDRTVFFLFAKKSFQSLWDSINAKKHPWKSNPWVWVYEFEIIEKPADFN